MGKLKNLRVALLWHSLRSDNLGVGALTVSDIQICVEAARQAGVEVEFDILGFGGRLHYPVTTANVSETVLVGWKNLLPGFTLWNSLRKSDLVIDIGAGDSFTDIYGLHRFIWIWWPKVMSIVQGKPLVLAPQTIGPFNKKSLGWLAGWAVRRAKLAFARDGRSRKVLDEMTRKGNVFESIDVAFALPYSAPLKTSARKRIGLNVSGLLFSGGYTKANQFGLTCDYPLAIAEIIEGLSKSDAEIVLVPHVVTDDGGVEDDSYVSEQLAARYPNVTVAPAFASPGDAKSFIAALDFFIGARMHATIAAASTGVPVVPMAYSRKFMGLYEALGYEHVADCTVLTTEQTVDYVLNCVAQTEALREAIATSRGVAQEKLSLYRNKLAMLFLEYAES